MITTHFVYSSVSAVFTATLIASSAFAWVPSPSRYASQKYSAVGNTALSMAEPSLHGQNSCFMPLRQLDQDYYAPRIVQIAGAYPGITREEFEAVTSEPSAEVGQWTYDFSNPDGPQLGTVAIEGSNSVACAEDPVVIIAEHPSLGIELSKELVDPVDLIVLVDRAMKTFAERRFLVLDDGSGKLVIGAYQTKGDMPPESEIVGHVILTQIPWLPCMAPTKTGFVEVDEYFTA